MTSIPGTDAATTGIASVIHPVRDVEAVKPTYLALYGEPHTDTPYYVGWNVAGLETALNPGGHALGLTAPTAYWGVADVEAALVALEAAGCTRLNGPQDVGGGAIVGHATDPEGGVVGIIRRG